MSIVVDALVMVPTVELSVFLLSIHSLVLYGLLALPYHLNQFGDSVCARRFIVIIFIKVEVILIIMLLAVVARARVLVVGLSLFMPRAMPVIPAGIVAPPYHLNLILDKKN